MRQAKVGLALGSGAAKGWAHIGVVNALVEMGIKIDVVAGCSVGALVGAACACQRLPVLEEWVRSFRAWDVLRLMDVSWRRGGLLRGDRVFSHVRTIIDHQVIETCPLRFGAVATNLSTGRELWFTRGDLHSAVRASCSIPGLLAPVSHNGYWLVDGAVVNPVPVSLTRAMGADIVIAVDLQHDAHLMSQELMSSPDGQYNPDLFAEADWRERLKVRLRRGPVHKKRRAPGAMEIMTTSIQVLENRIKLNRMAGDPPDILLQPRCPQISTLDFHRAEEAIAAGRQVVEDHFAELQPLVAIDE
ncbi:patatin-like phospholipase RssA [Entomohabitans teleogrylli]|uniref:patatin-like phospholipase RssA n=1 Tax=Entomohabitans teleogrylli TaxID=1384589 RepID=UPI00073D7D70|nr:patatin-like phospholipase RssA [Entomohabitans teleogrylli]